jgi:4-amino-4-deoxy-L-arabinose transferase-like glycosyltransferase
MRITGLLILLVVAAIIRCVAIEAHGLWADEFTTITNATGVPYSQPVERLRESFVQRDMWSENTLSNVVATVIMQDGGNGILYNFLLHFWIRTFGTRDLIVRLPSVMCGVLIVFLIHRLASELVSNRVAWWASAWVAVHPLLVRYSQETRAYALATLLALVATYTLVRIWKETTTSRGWWVWYGLAAGGAILSHYLSAGIMAGHAAFAVLRLRDRGVWIRLVGGSGLAGLVTGVWLVVGGLEGLQQVSTKNKEYEQRAHSARPDENFSLPATPGYLVAGLLQVGYAMSGNGLQRAGVRLRELIPCLLLPAAFLIGCWRGRGQLARVNGGLLLLGILASSSVVVSSVLALWAGHIISFQPHYSNFATPYLVILLAAGMSSFAAARGWRFQVGATLIAAQVVVLAISLKLVYEDAPLYRPPNRFAVVARQISAVATPQDVVSYPTWSDARLCGLYLPREATFTQRVNGKSSNELIFVIRGGTPIAAMKSAALGGF